MARTYTKHKRAEQETETRQRIVEATLGLHTDIGPARTTISMIAERAGVQRHTVYAHFPDERALLNACSGLHAERQPLPSPELWAALDDPASRLRAALVALYDWYGRNEAVAGAVLRDAEIHPVLREVAATAIGGPMGAIFMSLAEGLDAAGLARLHLALSYYTWRTLVRDAGLDRDAAVETMVSAIVGNRGD